MNAGDLIVVSAGFYFTTGQTITVKDNVNSTNYTYKGPTLVTANQNLGTWIYTTPLRLSANAFTVTLTVSEAGSQGPYLVLGIDEFSCGSGYTYSIDGSPGYQSSGGTNSITLASSLAVTGTDLIYAAAVSGTAAGVASADSGTGWTLSENAALISSQSFGLLTEYLLNDTTSVNPIVTSTTTVLSHLTGIAFSRPPAQWHREAHGSGPEISMPTFYLPYEYTSVLIDNGNVDPFGIDPEQTVVITTANVDPFGVDPEQTTLITVGLTSAD